MKTIINGTERVIKFSEFIKVKSISYLSSGAVYGKNCIKKMDGKKILNQVHWLMKKIQLMVYQKMRRKFTN